MNPDPEIVETLLAGPAHRFADGIAAEIPTSGAGVYTIWDEDGDLVYVGVAGRNPTGAGLASRLRSHGSGRRSGDQFCVYVADHYVLPELTRDQIKAIVASDLSMDSLVREKVNNSFMFRVAPAADYSAALALENWVKSGSATCGPPRLNPVR